MRTKKQRQWLPAAPRLPGAAQSLLPAGKHAPEGMCKDVCLLQRLILTVVHWNDFLFAAPASIRLV